MSMNAMNQATINAGETKFAWIDQLAAKVNECTGHYLGTDHVHSDVNGWYYYIQKKSLKANHPLLMNHYRGPLFAVIPHEDYARLERGEIDPIAYVDNAKWSFGYYWGGGSMIGGAFWQPLEEGTGIHDKEKISRYLSILRCRTHRNSSGYMPTEENCQKCAVNNCPFSKYAEKNANADWALEVQEHDYRIELFNAVIKRVQEELLLKVSGAFCYDGNNALLIPNDNGLKSCAIYLPVSILNDILYNPGERDWEKMASEFIFELGVMMKPDRLQIVPEELNVTPAEHCRNFWAAFNYSDNEAKEAEFEKLQDDGADEISDGGNWFTKLMGVFNGILKVRK